MRCLAPVAFILLVSSGCSAAGICGQAADLEEDCGEGVDSTLVASCRSTLRDCADEDVEALQDYLDCLTEGAERGECVIPDDSQQDPTKGCFALLLDANPTCVAAVTTL